MPRRRMTIRYARPRIPTADPVPVRFNCENCRSRLTVSRRFAGQTGRCPGCGKKIRIPEITIAGPEDQPAPPPDSGPLVQTEPPEAGLETATANRDDVPEVAGPVAPSTQRHGRPPERDPASLSETIPVPRWVVYVQASLLGIIATSFFVFGLAVGSNTPGSGRGPAPDSDVRISGTVLFERNGIEEVDESAVVMLLPVSARPDPRPDPQTLVPARFVPLDNSSIEIIRDLGGAVVRVNRSGRFQATVRGGRSYWLLIVSRNQSAGPQTIDKQMRADLGGFFFPVENLLQDRAFFLEKIRPPGGEYRVPAVVF